jgi:hypothetical protein
MRIVQLALRGSPSNVRLSGHTSMQARRLPPWRARAEPEEHELIGVAHELIAAVRSAIFGGLSPTLLQTRPAAAACRRCCCHRCRHCHLA